MDHSDRSRFAVSFDWRTQGGLAIARLAAYHAFSKAYPHHYALDWDQRIAWSDWLTGTWPHRHSALADRHSGFGVIHHLDRSARRAYKKSRVFESRPASADVAISAFCSSWPRTAVSPLRKVRAAPGWGSERAVLLL